MQRYLFLPIRYLMLIFILCLSIVHQYSLESSTSKQKKDNFPFVETHFYIPVLSKLAQKCKTFAEIGTRDLSLTQSILKNLSDQSTTPRYYLSIDLEYPPEKQLKQVEKLAKGKNIDFAFWRINNRHIDLEPTDMLLLDDENRQTYCYLTYQLETFSPKIRKYICLHNTSDPGEKQDNQNYQGNYEAYPNCDKNKKGIWQAIINFLEKHPEWDLLKCYAYKGGLTILVRKDSHAINPRFYDPHVEYYLKNKIILCTGPSLEKYDLLKKTTEADLHMIPFKKIFLSTNDQANMHITFNGIKPVCEYIGNREKTLDCLNCIFTTMKNAVNDPEVQNDDIILFKHESVFINDMGLMRKVISKMLDGADMVARNTCWGIGTGEFLVKVSAIRDIIKDYPIVTELPTDDFARANGVWNAETYFNAYIVKKIKNPYIIELSHSHWKFTELGLYHIPSFKNPNALTDAWGWPWWDKKNYDQLYQD